MTPLPDFRVETSLRLFTHTAVDFAGPFLTKQGRGKVETKRYQCLFTCAQTRAVHFERTRYRLVPKCILSYGE